MSAGLSDFGQVEGTLVDLEAAGCFAVFHAEQRRVDVVAGHEFLRLGQRHLRLVLGGTARAVGQA